MTTVNDEQLLQASSELFSTNTPTSRTEVYLEQKQAFARALAFLLLLGFGPAILFLALLVRCSSRGPAFYRQIRVGKRGELFEVIKLRTMRVDAERDTGPTLCDRRDVRVTFLGRIFRFFHLDELPQLVNVARGEMCLIGPRPERPEIIEQNKLLHIVPDFEQRTAILPGVTGLAQINLPADQTPKCVIPKVDLDLEYAKTASLGLDLRILACTFFRMFGVRHGLAVRFFGLHRQIDWNRVDRVWEERSHILSEASSIAREESIEAKVLTAVGAGSQAHPASHGEYAVDRYSELVDSGPSIRKPR